MEKYLNSPLAKYILGIVELILGLAFVLKTMEASLKAPFVRWLYAAADALASSFNGIFPNATVRAGGLFDKGIFTAMIVYAVLVFIPVVLHKHYQQERKMGEK